MDCKVSLSARNVPIGELNNLYHEFGLETDVKSEEVFLYSIEKCSHPVVVNMKKNNTHICVYCGLKKLEPFGVEVV